MSDSARFARLALLAAAALVPLLLARQGRDLKLLAAVPLCALAVPALLAARGRGLPEPRRLTVLWLVTFAAVASYALAQKAGLDPVAEYRAFRSSDRVFATFGNPDFLGAHAAMLLPLFLALAVAGMGRLAQMAAAASALDALVLLLTFSRGAWLGAAAGCAAWAAVALPPARRRRAFLALAGAILLTVGGLLATATGRAALARRTDRLLLWQGTLAMIRERPLTGWGWGSFPAEFPPFAPPAFESRMKADNTFAEHPHAEYLHVAVEAGLPGLGVFCWALAAILARGASAARSGKPAAAGAVGAFTAVLVHAAVDRNFRLASTAAPFWLLAASLWSGRIRLPALPRFGIIVAAAVAAGFAVWSLRPLHASIRVAAERDFLADRPEMSSREIESRKPPDGGDAAWWRLLGDALAKERRFERAAAAFEEAARLDPRSAAPLTNLGNCRFMLSHFDAAADAYRRALALEPANLDAKFNLAFTYFHQRRIKDALRETDAILRADPRNAKALQLRSQLAP